MKPIHKHDCDACVHVTTMYVPGNGTCDGGRWYDIYYCEKPSGRREYLARYGVGDPYESLFRKGEGYGVGEPTEQQKQHPSMRSWTLWKHYAMALCDEKYAALNVPTPDSREEVEA